MQIVLVDLVITYVWECIGACKDPDLAEQKEKD